MNNCCGIQWHTTWSEGWPGDVTKYYRGVKCLDSDEMLAQSVLPHTTHMFGWEDGRATPIEPLADVAIWWNISRGLPIDGYKYDLDQTEIIK